MIGKLAAFLVGLSLRTCLNKARQALTFGLFQRLLLGQDQTFTHIGFGSFQPDDFSVERTFLILEPDQPLFCDCEIAGQGFAAGCRLLGIPRNDLPSIFELIHALAGLAK